MLSIIKTASSLEVILDGKPFSIAAGSKTYEELLARLRAKAPECEILDILERAKALQKRGLEVEDSEVYYMGEQVHGTMVNRLFELIDLGLDVDPIKNFIKRLMQSPRPVMDLYDFLEVGSMPITKDGTFLAYKVVTKDYKDKHTGKIDNSVGAVVEMKYSDVDDNPNRTCSSGLHFCSFEYIMVFLTPGAGDRILLVEIDPADVVAIPADYNNTKARCCKYRVVEDVTEKMADENDTLRDILAESKTGYDFQDEGDADDLDEADHDEYTSRDEYSEFDSEEAEESFEDDDEWYESNDWDSSQQCW